jgi:hypothetical protein
LGEEKETEYEKFFNKKLKKFGVSSPNELSAEDKKRFFAEIEDGWDGDDEDDIDESLLESTTLKYIFKDENSAKKVATYLTKSGIDFDLDGKEISVSEKDLSKEDKKFIQLVKLGKE